MGTVARKRSVWGPSGEHRWLSDDKVGSGGGVRFTIPQAAEILGVKEDTIRKRIQRKTLQSIKGEHRVHVIIPADEYRRARERVKEASEDASGDKSQDVPGPSQDTRGELAESLREQVAYLQGVIATRDKELAQRAEEIRRRDAALEREQQLAAMFADRLRELEAPREQARPGPSGARMSPETAPGGPGSAWDTWQGEPKEPSDYSEQARERRESPVSSGPIDAPQSPAEEAHGTAERPFTEEEPQPERSWWRRFFGF